MIDWKGRAELLERQYDELHKLAIAYYTRIRLWGGTPLELTALEIRHEAERNG